jgi:hypothetical protein
MLSFLCCGGLSENVAVWACYLSLLTKYPIESDTYLELVIESGFLMTIKQSSIIFACPPPPVLALVLLHIFSDSKLFSCIPIPEQEERLVTWIDRREGKLHTVN